MWPSELTNTGPRAVVATLTVVGCAFSGGGAVILLAPVVLQVARMVMGNIHAVVRAGIALRGEIAAHGGPYGGCAFRRQIRPAAIGNGPGCGLIGNEGARLVPCSVTSGAGESGRLRSQQTAAGACQSAICVRDVARRRHYLFTTGQRLAQRG